MPQSQNTGNSSTILLSVKLLFLACFLYTFNHDKSTNYITLVNKNAESYSSNPLFSPSNSPSKTEKPEGPDETTPSKEPPLISDPSPKIPDQPNEHTPSHEEPKTPSNEGENKPSTTPEQPPTPTDTGENKPSPTEEQPQTPPHPGGNEPSPTQETPVPSSHTKTSNIPKTPRAYQKSPMEKVNAKDWDGPSAFLEKGGVIETRDIREIFICRLNTNHLCRSKYIADSIDLLWAFCPIYSPDQPNESKLYAYHTYFLGYVKSIGIKTVVLEAIYPGQRYLKTTAGNEPWEIQLVVNDTFYLRENFLNVAAKKTKGWEYMLWIDAHQTFLNIYWWEETIHKLEHRGSLQLYQTLAHLSDQGNGTIPWLDLSGVQYAYTITKDVRNWIEAGRGMFIGNAFGISRDLYEKIGYILDFCVTMCCDCAYNYALMTDYWDRLDIYPHYGSQMMPWVERVRKIVNGTAGGVVRGKMHHFGHEHLFKLHTEEFAYTFHNLTEELHRDENFTLYLKDDSPLLQIYPKLKFN